jgi:hypothetical protein
MQLNRKRIVRIAVIFVMLLPLTSFAHFIIFPQETRSILIGFSAFKKEGDLYFNLSTSKNSVDSVESLIVLATERVARFWGDKKASPTFIYCEESGDFRKYSVSPGAPAVTYCKLGEHIVLSKEGVDLDIISHEISHAELYARVGFYIWTFKLPDWFKHGLAMQNDYRSYYSLDTLKAKTNDLKTMPDITYFKTSSQFYSGTMDQIMLRYMTAKYVIGKWYTQEKLQKLIQDLKVGKSFDESFKKVN